MTVPVTPLDLAAAAFSRRAEKFGMHCRRHCSVSPAPRNRAPSHFSCIFAFLALSVSRDPLAKKITGLREFGLLSLKNLSLL